MLSGPGIPGVQYHGIRLAKDLLQTLTDLTLANEVSNSILTDDANRTIIGNVSGAIW